MRIKDFKVGQTVFVEQIENAKRRKGGKEIIEEWEITKVGKKYIYAMGTEGALPGNACKPKRKEERLFSKAVKKGDAEQCNKYEKDNRWIPCSERLPEEKEKRFGKKQKRTEVLVTLRNGLVKEMTFEFATKEFWEAGDENQIEHWKEDANDSGCEVIAWQPLPEPYKED